jgi:DNA polymerase-3 subunit delta
MAGVRANNPFALKELKANIGRWNGPQLFRVLGLIREYDAKSKGINDGGLDSGDLLKELLLKIFMS